MAQTPRSYKTGDKWSYTSSFGFEDLAPVSYTHLDVYKRQGELLGIALLDSLIVTPQGAFYSAAEESFGQLTPAPRERREEVADGP